jgi:hypothetical protein
MPVAPEVGLRRLPIGPWPWPGTSSSQASVGVDRPVGELPNLAGGGAEEGRSLLADDAGRFDDGPDLSSPLHGTSKPHPILRGVRLSDAELGRPGWIMRPPSRDICRPWHADCVAARRACRSHPPPSRPEGVWPALPVQRHVDPIHIVWKDCSQNQVIKLGASADAGPTRAALNPRGPWPCHYIMIII